MERGRKRVVVIGGGFGGLACARALDGRPVEVLLVDRQNYHLFTPLLYQVATSLLDPSAVAYPLRMRFRNSRNVRFRQAQVTRVDAGAKEVFTADGDVIGYDQLVLATGSANNYFGNERLATTAIGLKTLDEALRLRNHVLASLELAARAKDAEERRRRLTFLVAGGGPTGVEYAGALAELLKIVLGRDYPELRPGSSRIVLVEGQEALLGAFAPRLQAYAARALRQRGVELKLGVLVKEGDASGAMLSDGEVIPSGTIVWSAGVTGSFPPLEPGGPIQPGNRIAVDAKMRLSGDEVFVIGDAAAVSAGGHGYLPMLSPPAMQEGRFVARLIASGATPRPFHYRDKGTLATIGRRAAVGQVGRFQFTGFVGWVAWLAVHLYYLVGFRNRLVVFAAWTWNYLRKDRPLRIVAAAAPDPAVSELEAREPLHGTPGGW